MSTACENPIGDPPLRSEWFELREAHQRLRWARAARYSTAKAFAEALGLAYVGYSAHERDPGSSKHTRLTAEKAMRFARLLEVRWEWLFNGEGAPWKEGHTRPQTEAGMEVARLVDEIEDAGEQALIVETVKALIRNRTKRR